MRRIGSALPRLANLLALVVACFFGCFLALFALFGEDQYRGLSDQIYGPASPLMGSAFLEAFMTPYGTGLVLATLTLLVAKEFFVRTLRLRLSGNLLALAVALGLTLTIIAEVNAPIMEQGQVDSTRAP